jgi:hypothetical protein
MLILTYAHLLIDADGDSLGNVTNQHIVLFICSPIVAGTHPQTAPACDELGAVGGDFGQLRGAPMRLCEFIYKPATAAADGIWHGGPVSDRHTFPNKCVEQNSNEDVFAF